MGVLTSTFFPILVLGISQRNPCSKLHRTARIINPASASRLIRQPASEIIQPTKSNSCKHWNAIRLRADANSPPAVKYWKSFDRSGTRKFKPGQFTPLPRSTSWNEQSKTDYDNVTFCTPPRQSGPHPVRVRLLSPLHPFLYRCPGLYTAAWAASIPLPSGGKQPKKRLTSLRTPP